MIINVNGIKQETRNTNQREKKSKCSSLIEYHSIYVS